MIRLYPKILKAEQRIYEYQKELGNAESEAAQKQGLDGSVIQALRDHIAEAEEECRGLTENLHQAEHDGQELQEELARCREDGEALQQQLGRSESECEFQKALLEQHRRDRAQDLERFAGLERELQEQRTELQASVVARHDSEQRVAQNQKETAELSRRLVDLGRAKETGALPAALRAETMVELIASRTDTTEAVVEALRAASDRGEAATLQAQATASRAIHDSEALRRALTTVEEAQRESADLEFGKAGIDRASLWRSVRSHEVESAAQDERLSRHSQELADSRAETEDCRRQLSELLGIHEGRCEQRFAALERAHASDRDQFSEQFAGVDRRLDAHGSRVDALEKGSVACSEQLKEVISEASKLRDDASKLQAQTGNLVTQQQETDMRLEKLEKKGCVIL